ncbi:hypothetical protein, partial [Flavobacterium psychrophilum]|uniref:hypothetical protein n=1 Tax=Flavobacterium psychrophilum TaxID=96345 RepID=UPI0019554272
VNKTPATNSRFELVCDLVELPFRIIFSAKPKIERLRTSQPSPSGETMEKIALRDNFFHRAPATRAMKNHRCFRTMFFHHPLC